MRLAQQVMRSMDGFVDSVFVDVGLNELDQMKTRSMGVVGKPH